MKLKFLPTISFVFAFSMVGAQTPTVLDSVINVIEAQKGDLIYDTSSIYNWSATNGEFTTKVFAEFKVLPRTKTLLRVVAFEEGKERITFYYLKGKPVAAKIDFSEEFRSWNGRTINIEHAESNDVVLSEPGDESEPTVSTILASLSYDWLRYFQKGLRNNH